MTLWRAVEKSRHEGDPAPGNSLFTLFRQHCGMNASRSIANLEADLVALRAAAERAGTALACLFSSSDEFEAAVVKVRREQGAYRAQGRRRPIWSLALVAVVVLAFVLL
jgi:hypothetical protein